jgi:hypothetical protein
MAARYRPDSIGHGHHGQTKRQRDRENAQGKGWPEATDHHRAATEKYKRRRANELGNVFLHDGPRLSNPSS